MNTMPRVPIQPCCTKGATVAAGVRRLVFNASANPTALTATIALSVYGAVTWIVPLLTMLAWDNTMSGYPNKDRDNS